MHLHHRSFRILSEVEIWITPADRFGRGRTLTAPNLASNLTQHVLADRRARSGNAAGSATAVSAAATLFFP